MTTAFDAAGEGSARACWALIRRARADRFESASSTAKPSPFQRVALPRSEKPDTYWSAPRHAKRPVISTTEIRYVRRSEHSRARHRAEHQRPNPDDQGSPVAAKDLDRQPPPRGSTRFYV